MNIFKKILETIKRLIRLDREDDKSSNPPPPPEPPPKEDPMDRPWQEAIDAPDSLWPGAKWKKYVRNGLLRFKYIGTHGLYKYAEYDKEGKIHSRSRLYIMPRNNPLNNQKIFPYHIKSIGVYGDKEGINLINWCSWPSWHKSPDGNIWLSNKPMDGYWVIGKQTYEQDITDDQQKGFYVHGDRGQGIKCRNVSINEDGQWIVVKDIYDKIIISEQIYGRHTRQEGKT